MKYFKFKNEVYAFELDGSQDHLITKEHVAMTDEDVDRHVNPHKYYSGEERRTFYLASLRPLTRRQFKLALLENGLLDQIENSISAIEDDQMRARIQIEYTEATEFHRTSDAVAYICQLLGLPDEQIDQMWEQALTL